MPNQKTSVSLYLLGLTTPLASAMPSTYRVSNSTASAITELSRVQNSSFHAPHKVKVHGTYHITEHDVARHNVVEIIQHYLLERDADDTTSDETHPDPDPVPYQHPIVDVSIKKGGGGAGTRGSSGGSYTDSSGIGYDKNGYVTSIPLGTGNPVYMPFGGIFGVPGWNSASVLDGSFVMARAMALSAVTVLAVYWIL
ncbi:hypothetical protein F5B21DRAFT_464497 [Xylaria acuta]|nr:hypothetical protein F5B21DRAFT_464497 [Xylaria acuta]